MSLSYTITNTPNGRQVQVQFARGIHVSFPDNKGTRGMREYRKVGNTIHAIHLSTSLGFASLEVYDASGQSIFEASIQGDEFQSEKQALRDLSECYACSDVRLPTYIATATAIRDTGPVNTRTDRYGYVIKQPIAKQAYVDGKWRRVYLTQTGNTGTRFVRLNGITHILHLA